MNYQFQPEASTELDEAIAHYEGQRKGLGLEMLAEVQAALDQICRTPVRFPTFHGRHRKARTRRFPYGIIYRVEPDFIYVVTVAHLHRRPGYWRSRD